MQKFPADELYARDSRSGIGDIFVPLLIHELPLPLDVAYYDTLGARAIFYVARIDRYTSVSQSPSRVALVSPTTQSLTPLPLSPPLRETLARLSIAKIRGSSFPRDFHPATSASFEFYGTST